MSIEITITCDKCKNEIKGDNYKELEELHLCPTCVVKTIDWIKGEKVESVKGKLVGLGRNTQ